MIDGDYRRKIFGPNRITKANGNICALQIPLAFGDLAFFQRVRQFTGLHTSTTPKLPKLEHATLALTIDLAHRSYAFLGMPAGPFQLIVVQNP
jgi:hypothetical protein